MAIKEVQGNLLQSDRIVRCIAVNCSGNVTGDFAKEIKEKYPEVVKPYTEMCRVVGEKAMGEVQLIVCHDETIIACMFVQEVGIGNRAVVDMGALEDCLNRICIFGAKTGFSTGVPKNLGVSSKYIDWETAKQHINTYLDTCIFDCQILEIPHKQRKGTAVLEPPAAAGAPPAMEAPTAAKAETSPESLPATEESMVAQKRKVVVIEVEASKQNSKEWVATLHAKAGSKQLQGTAEGHPTALTGVVTALSVIKVPCNISLYVDDVDFVQAIRQGTEGKPGLWEKLDKLMNIHNVIVHHTSEIPVQKAS